VARARPQSRHAFGVRRVPGPPRVNRSPRNASPMSPAGPSPAEGVSSAGARSSTPAGRARTVRGPSPRARGQRGPVYSYDHRREGGGISSSSTTTISPRWGHPGHCSTSRQPAPRTPVELAAGKAGAPVKPTLSTGLTRNPPRRAAVSSQRCTAASLPAPGAWPESPARSGPPARSKIRRGKRRWRNRLGRLVVLPRTTRLAPPVQLRNVVGLLVRSSRACQDIGERAGW